MANFMKKVLSLVRRMYSLYKIKKIMTKVMTNSFNTAWGKYKDSGYTEKQVALAVALAVVKVLNECDSSCKWSVDVEENV